MEHKHSHKDYSFREHRLLNDINAESVGTTESSNESINNIAIRLKEYLDDNPDDNDIAIIREELHRFYKQEHDEAAMQNIEIGVRVLAKMIDSSIELPEHLSNEDLTAFVVESGLLTRVDIIRFQTERALDADKKIIESSRDPEKNVRMYKIGDTRGRYKDGNKFTEVCTKAGTKATSEWMVKDDSIITIEEMRTRLHATREALSAEKKERARAAKERWRHLDLLQSDPLYRRTYETRQRLAERFGGTAVNYGRIDTKPQGGYFDRTGTDREWARRNSPPPRVSVEETVVTSSDISFGPGDVKDTAKETVRMTEKPSEGSKIEIVKFDEDNQAVLDRLSQELILDKGITIRKTEDNAAVLYVDRTAWGLSSDEYGGIRIPANTLTVTVIGPGEFALTGTGVAGTFKRSGDTLTLELRSSTRVYGTEWRKRGIEAVAAPSVKEAVKVQPPAGEEKPIEKSKKAESAVEDPMLRSRIYAKLLSTKAQMDAMRQEWVTIANGLRGFEYSVNQDGFFARNEKGEVYKVDSKTLKTILVSKPEKKQNALFEKAKNFFSVVSEKALDEAAREKGRKQLQKRLSNVREKLQDTASWAGNEASKTLEELQRISKDAQKFLEKKFAEAKQDQPQQMLASLQENVDEVQRNLKEIIARVQHTTFDELSAASVKRFAEEWIDNVLDALSFAKGEPPEMRVVPRAPAMPPTFLEQVAEKESIRQQILAAEAEVAAKKAAEEAQKNSP